MVITKDFGKKLKGSTMEFVGIYAKKGINCTRRYGFGCVKQGLFGKMLQKC